MPKNTINTGKIFRRCILCGFEAKNQESLELFVKKKDAKFGHSNICKKCSNSLYSDVHNKNAKIYRERHIRFLKRKYFGSICCPKCNKKGYLNGSFYFNSNTNKYYLTKNVLHQHFGKKGNKWTTVIDYTCGLGQEYFSAELISEAQFLLISPREVSI